MTYEEWEKGSGFSGLSPEAYYAEIAWNAAVTETMRVIKATEGAETTISALIVLQLTELNAMDTGFRGRD